MAPENAFQSLAAAMMPIVTTADGTLDLEAVIARFAGDASCTSYALPASLNSDQRQLAKKLVGRHPHLECESYGFGVERQLHLFKKSAVKGRVRTRVKNTFIDAWLENSQGNKLGLAPMFRSLPSDWRKAAVAASNIEVSSICDSVLKENKLCPSPPCKALDTVDFSKCDDVQDGERICSVCVTPSPGNTPKADISVLPRSTAQSLEEARDPIGTEIAAPNGNGPTTCVSEQTAGGLATCPPPVSPPNVVMLDIGTEVEIDGLIARPDFNGLSGVVRSWDPMLRRYEVLLDIQPVGHGSRLVKTKRSNLRLRPPPPPAVSAATQIDLCSCLPSEEGQLIDGTALVIDATPSSNESPGQWAHWQFCDPSMSPSTGGNEFYGVSEQVWDYGMSFNETAASYDTSDGAAWLQPSLCDTQGWVQA